LRPLNLAPGTLTRSLTQSIPASAPAGQYTYYVFLGDAAEQSVWNFDSFAFTKSGSQGGADGWNLEGWDQLAAQENGLEGSAKVAAVAVSPNPFNPSTTVQFTMPSAGEASVALFDLQGRQVMELRDSFGAGLQHFEVPGQNLASGIYLLRLKTAAYTSEAKVLRLK
jgi:hypothetical protein